MLNMFGNGLQLEQAVGCMFLPIKATAPAKVIENARWFVTVFILEIVEWPLNSASDFRVFRQCIRFGLCARALGLDDFSVFGADSTPVYLISECL